ncbi:SRPBCC family protein [Patulibacter defluvii]|uniref:SRPBCC family protein n=1 Tax=Patulibacter defluvii TaxID=3095358 RepID=UPI002A74806D|nr:SRPBCC family protein [Patulibacter sp. DM4]
MPDDASLAPPLVDGPTAAARPVGPAIEARRTVAVAPDALFAFLADLENHWAIAARFVRVVRLEGPPGAHDGSVLRVAGPLGLHRTTRARIVETVDGRSIVGIARVGRRTAARVAWRLDPGPDGGGTAVTLRADVLRASPGDRLLLALGGRWWLRRGFAAALRSLADACQNPADGPR